MTTFHKSHPTLAPARDLLAQLEQIMLRIDGRVPSVADHIGEAALVLETLPLATGEFAVARNRLCNATRYLDQSEWGAARYEVQLVLYWLKTSINRFNSVPAVA